MIVSYKNRFVEPILNKTKKHTLREDIHNRWKQGMKMHMATGVRTKKYNQFYEDTCKSIQKIKIKPTSEYLNGIVVDVDGRKLTETEVQQLAWNGFVNLIDFWMWFKDGFDGKILHLTDLKY
ncbi:MAG: hypothetical protein ACOC10_07225 [Bacteroidota bacterium]